GFNDRLKNELEKALCASPGLVTMASADGGGDPKADITIQYKADGFLSMKTDDGRDLPSTKLSSSASEREKQFAILDKTLRTEGLWRYIKSLRNPDTKLLVDARLVPIEMLQAPADGRPAKTKDLAPTEALTEGEYFQVEIMNPNDRPIYVNVLD